jgi:hypothetical protein
VGATHQALGKSGGLHPPYNCQSVLLGSPLRGQCQTVPITRHGSRKKPKRGHGRPRRLLQPRAAVFWEGYFQRLVGLARDNLQCLPSRRGGRGVAVGKLGRCRTAHDRGLKRCRVRCEAEKISNEKLFNDLKRQLVSVSELVEVTRLVDLLGEKPPAAELRDYLSESLRGTWSNRWWKAPSSGGGAHKNVKTRVLGNHTSTYRVLQQAKT